ncbi:hypothetical protein [Paenibacillus gyeongsangnamensis]|uniref:hypothetical protein n=1 Tax=Paenibacillus gyeongsangnamensis TaxID=3388067 RepID=UPI002FD66E50
MTAGSRLSHDCEANILPRVRVGVSVWRRPGASSSFRRDIRFDVRGLLAVIEYAIYWDYDIQHLYELEHIWVFVGEDGEVWDAEASFHGKTLKALLKNRSNLTEGTHVRLFSQPGKHAFSPLAEVFELLPDWRTACMEEAGRDGLTVPDMFKGAFFTDELTNRLVERHLKTLAFEPAMEFKEYRLRPELFVPWATLAEEIPLRIARELKRLRERKEAEKKPWKEPEKEPWKEQEEA